jgi:hypothetical protein
VTRGDIVAAVIIGLTAVSSAMGWDQARTNDDQRLTAIQTMAEALAACERRHHTHGGTP